MGSFNDQTMTPRVNDGKEGHSNREFTHREMVANMDATGDPGQTLLAACSTAVIPPFILDDKLPVSPTPGPKKNA